MLVLAAAGFGVWNHLRGRLGDGLVLKELNRQVGREEIEFGKVAIETAQDSGTQRELRVEADGKVREDLFTVRTAETVARELDAENLARLRQLRRTLAEPDGAAAARALEAEIGAPPADSLGGQFLVPVTPRGTAIGFSGTMLATRGPDGWVLAVTGGDLAPGRPAGQLRSAFAAELRVLDDAVKAQLKRDLAAAGEFAAKFDAARVAHAEKLQREREERRAALLTALAPGTCFFGQAEPVGGGAPIPGLVLEIVSAQPASRQVSALLRNDGGWAEARAFQGTFDVDDQSSVLKLSLATRSAQAVEQAGPLLANREGWTLALQLEGDSRLTGKSPAHQYVLTRLGESERERLRTEMGAAFERALAATQNGTVYRGTAVAKDSSREETVLLRFTRQEKNGAQLAAELEIENTPGRSRPFRGSVTANRHRAGGAPIRLTSAARDRLANAGDTSVAGLNRELVVALTPDGTALAGADTSFTYKLERLDADAFAKLDAERKAARDAFFAAVKRGNAYGGTAQHTDGFSTPVRLRITSVNADTGAVEGALESVPQNGVNARLTGRFTFADRSLRFTAAVGKAAGGNALRLPLFARNGRGNVVLTVGERSIDGALEGSAEWSFSFPLTPN